MADLYDRLLDRLRQEHIPIHILWEITHRCNLACVMCYNAPHPGPELTLTESCRIVDQLAAAGGLRLTLTGGEVLVVSHFFELATYARRAGFALEIKTNGTLITPETADRLAALEPLQVDISLLAATPATADRITGRRRSLERTLRGVALLQKRGVPVKLNSLLMALNRTESRSLVELAQSLGLPHELFVKISPDDRGIAKAAHHQLSPTDITQLFAHNLPACHPSQNTGQRTCQVGLASCLISPDGIVYPCIELRSPLGNLRTQTFADIWQSSPLLQQLRQAHLRANLHECRGCELIDYCAGRCAGVAFKESGDWLAGDSLACRQAQAYFAHRHPDRPIPTPPRLVRATANGPERPSPDRQPIVLAV